MSNSENKTKKSFTLNKAQDALIIILLIISILGIIAFAYSFISAIIQGTFSIKSVINIIYILMYVSIVQYIVTFFIKHKMASIHAILGNYCMLTLMCTITLPNILDYPILLVLVVAVVALVPLMRNNLASVKRCIGVMWTILALVAIMTALKIYYGFYELTGANPFLTMVALFNCFHPLIVWVIFMLLYATRVRIVSVLDKDYIKSVGLEEASKSYEEQLNAYLQEEKESKKKSKKKDKDK